MSAGPGPVRWILPGARRRTVPPGRAPESSAPVQGGADSGARPDERPTPRADPTGSAGRALGVGGAQWVVTLSFGTVPATLSDGRFWRSAPAPSTIAAVSAVTTVKETVSELAWAMPPTIAGATRPEV